jgi:transcriptional regulator with XRE-family HTH domain
MEFLKEQIGKRISDLRKDKGFSQEKLAGLADIDRTYVCDIEKGGRNISITILKKVSEALGVSMSKLLKDL